MWPHFQGLLGVAVGIRQHLVHESVSAAVRASQVKPSQAKSSQVKPNQAKSSQVKAVCGTGGMGSTQALSGRTGCCKGTLRPAELGHNDGGFYYG